MNFEEDGSSSALAFNNNKKRKLSEVCDEANCFLNRKMKREIDINEEAENIIITNSENEDIRNFLLRDLNAKSNSEWKLIIKERLKVIYY